MKVNVIRHLAFEDLGSFAGILHEQGAEVRYLEAGMDDLSVLQADDDLLVILGGPISVNEVAEYPFLESELALLKQRLALDKPTLGICLGAQLMAVALGAKVYPGEQKEIGWYGLQVNADGRAAGLESLDEKYTQMLHWHGETFDLPEGAVRLASSHYYPNQAFSYGENCLALQFHPEVTTMALERWFIGHTGEIHQTKGVSVAQLRQATQQYAALLEQNARVFFQQWLHKLGLVMPQD